MEKLAEQLKKYWWIGITLLTMLYPLYGRFFDGLITLNGVTAEAEAPEMTKSGLWDGSFQTALNTYWEGSFPGRSALIRLRNQMLYDIGESPNANVIIGKDKYLYEPGYIKAELMTEWPYEREYYEAIGDRLETLMHLLAENGKEMYVFITPSKADFYRDKIPNRYMILDSKDDNDFCQYSILLENLDRRGIPYFDSVAFVRENLNTGLFKAPLFYATGIHWNQPWGEMCAAKFLEVMNKNSRYDLGEAAVTEVDSAEPVYPGTDLYDSLNLIRKPKDHWYNAEIRLTREGKDHPNVFFRGGSFMEESTANLIWLGIFGKDVQYENHFYLTDCFSKQYILSGFSAYDEAPLDRLVGQADIVVLEVNEAAISNMSFGFIEYALEHPEILDSVYEEEAE